MTDTLHPDRLVPGNMVGPWRIVESLGSGNFGHAFKVERDGELFTLKMAVRPAPEQPQDAPEKTRDGRHVDGRMRHEAAILMANNSHPSLPHLRAVDRWPHPTQGYLYFVTDHVPGEAFHDWRERTQPNAAQMVDIFIAVVRTVVPLHRRGILIRDFKSEHVIVNPADNTPMVVDLGSARMPGASTLTVGLAPGTPHMLPPESVTFLREGTWKQGARFDVSEAGDLYQLGVFMYEALTECWPFDPRLTTDELLTAIQTVVPRAPHRLNPEVPVSLSSIAMRLLEKRPEDRYASAEALLQALWDAAKERTKRSWKVRLRLPPEGPAPMTQEEVEERRLHKQESERRAQEAQKQKTEELAQEEAFEELSAAIQEMGAQVSAAKEKAARLKKVGRRIALVSGSLLLSFVLFTSGWVWFTSATTSPAELEKGSSLVSTLSNSRPIRAAAAWLCTTFAVGCTATQVRPLPGDCPLEVVQSMREMNLLKDTYRVIIDINQPGTESQDGIYRQGPIVSKVVKYDWTGPLPEGTLLYGQLWTEGITKYGERAALVRYTEALLPDGRRLPVCFILGDMTGLTTSEPEARPGEVLLPREWTAQAVRYWP
jgi:serine/threonine protein kinase